MGLWYGILMLGSEGGYRKTPFLRIWLGVSLHVGSRLLLIHTKNFLLTLLWLLFQVLVDLWRIGGDIFAALLVQFDLESRSWRDRRCVPDTPLVVDASLGLKRVWRPSVPLCSFYSEFRTSECIFSGVVIKLWRRRPMNLILCRETTVR